jgi:3'-5' exoribonuclease
METTANSLYGYVGTLPAYLHETCLQVINDPLFQQCPAALTYHHCYEGGLAVHTLEVLEYALAAAKALPLNDDDMDVLITAAIWHDYMKIREYVRGEAGAFESDRGYYGVIGHIAGSAIEFSKTARFYAVPPEIEERIVHCLLSHHGRREWGSPVEPQTVEALLLHQADMLSAKFGTRKSN